MGNPSKRVVYDTNQFVDTLGKWEGSNKDIYTLGDGYVTATLGQTTDANPALKSFENTYGFEKDENGNWKNHRTELSDDDYNFAIQNAKKRVLNSEVQADKYFGDRANYVRENFPNIYATLMSKQWNQGGVFEFNYDDPSYKTRSERRNEDFRGLRTNLLTYIDDPSNNTAKYRAAFYHNTPSEADERFPGLARRYGSERAQIAGHEDYTSKSDGSEWVGYFSRTWNPKWGHHKEYSDGTKADYDFSTGYVTYTTPEGYSLSTNPTQKNYWKKENADFTSEAYNPEPYKLKRGPQITGYATSIIKRR